MNKKLYIPLIGGLLIGGLCVIHFFGAQLGFLGYLADHTFPGIVSSSSYFRVIEERKNLSDVYDAYYVLGSRHDPIAVDFALEDIHSNDDYLWLNAGHYLGILEREESIPYLIKALRHTAWRSDQERVTLLRKLTGKDFGNDFEKWKNWWATENPDYMIDWSSSLGFQPRINEIRDQADGDNG